MPLEENDGSEEKSNDNYDSIAVVQDITNDEASTLNLDVQQN